MFRPQRRSVPIPTRVRLQESANNLLYRGYHFERKTLMVGSQVTITRDDVFVQHTTVSKTSDEAITEARAYIDELLLREGEGQVRHEL
jgi:hypothetical protein